MTDSLVRSGLDVLSIDIDERFFEQLPKYGLDRALIMLHGSRGEDGVLQGALESYDLPYTGSGILASAAAMDKLHSKIFWKGSNIRTPAFSLLEKTTNWKETLKNLAAK